ncbi:hypothetical protein F4814DRAFT_424430 [Daldinia grandis]|nr:hypothetical protein F4814DRAFT_424430 [Daldinia grandis]
MPPRQTRPETYGVGQQPSGDDDPFASDGEMDEEMGEEDEWYEGDEGDEGDEGGEGNEDYQEDEDEFTDSSLSDPDSEREDLGKKRKGGGKATNQENIEEMMRTYSELPAELRTLARDYPKRVKRVVHSSAAYIAKHKGALKSMQDLLGWFPTDEALIGEGQIWTQALEDEFQQDLIQDPYLAYLEASTPPKSNERYIAMWKKICRLRRVFPPNVISPLMRLEYGATARVNLADGTTRPDPIWSSAFCDRLTKLALGGPWGDDMELLAMFVRYASACRIDDRGPIPLFTLTNQDRSWFLRHINDKLTYNRDPNKTIPQAHQEARRAVQTSGYKLSWHSQMMRNIEELVFERAAQPPRNDGGDGYRTYSVLTEDLRAVERAVSNCKDLGRPLFASVRDACRIVSHGRSFDYPKTYEHVKTLLKGIYVEEKRGLEKRRLEEMRSVARPEGLPINDDLDMDDDPGMDNSDIFIPEAAPASPAPQEPARIWPRSRTLPPYLDDPDQEKEEVEVSDFSYGAWGWGEVHPLNSNFHNAAQFTNAPNMDGGRVGPYSRNSEVWIGSNKHVTTSLTYRDVDSDSESE